MRGNGKIILLRTLVVSLLVLFTSVVTYGGTLQEEFDRLCVHTQDAESLSLERLQDLVAECDQLQKKIEASDDEKKKLLLFRLKKCRDFLAYVLELKQIDKQGPQQ